MTRHGSVVSLPAKGWLLSIFAATERAPRTTPASSPPTEPIKPNGRINGVWEPKTEFLAENSEGYGQGFAGLGKNEACLWGEGRQGEVGAGFAVLL